MCTRGRDARALEWLTTVVIDAAIITGARASSNGVLIHFQRCTITVDQNRS